MNWPEWREWELEFTPHLEKRMQQRDFTEIDLRGMLERAKNYKPAETEGRWIIEARHRRKNWYLIVEPDYDEKLLVIITAYPL